MKVPRLYLFHESVKCVKWCFQVLRSFLSHACVYMPVRMGQCILICCDSPSNTGPLNSHFKHRMGTSANKYGLSFTVHQFGHTVLGA